MKEIELLRYLRNRGYIIPSGWKINSKHSLSQIMDEVNRVNGEALGLEDFGQFLTRNNIKFND
jgi:hypothetical protein